MFITAVCVIFDQTTMAQQQKSLDWIFSKLEEDWGE